MAFLYPKGYTLFVFGDRVWQLRFTKPYSGSIYGLFLGDGSDKVCRSWASLSRAAPPISCTVCRINPIQSD